MSIQNLAREALEYFVLKERPDGETFWTVKEGAPPWVRGLCFKAHDNGEILPDDWRYRFIVESLETLSESENPYDVYIETYSYSGELLKWFSSSLTRLQWVEEAVEGMDWEKFDMLLALQAGQLHEKEHVFNVVLNELSRLVDAQECRPQGPAL